MARLIESLLGHEQQKKRVLAQTRAKKFASGLLFSGPEGIGKRKLALAALQELNCAQPEACGQCEPCLKIEKNADVFLHFVDIQNDKIKVEAVRDLLQFATLKSWVPHRFILLNQIEKITPQAANALLKTLEEPPEGLHFILLTSNLSQVLPTVRSRCQVLSFSPLSDDVLKKLIPELEPWQLRWSFGRVSLAQKIVQESWQDIRKASINFLHSSQNSKVYEELLSYMSDPSAAEFVGHSWMTYLRDAFLLQKGFSQEIYNQDIQTYAQKFAEKKEISRLFDVVFQFRQDLLGHVDKNLLLDFFSIQLEAPINEGA